MDLLNQVDRKLILKDINSEENKRRKAASQREFEVFKGELNKYVVEYLKQQFAYSTVKEMPIISSINLSKKIVTSEASIYKNAPERDFTNATEDVEDALKELYADMAADAKLNKLNQIYKLQNQALLYVVPKKGKLYLKCLYSHQYDVIPNDENPEVADGYIISVFDKQNYNDSLASEQETKGTNFVSSPIRNNVNTKIADDADYKAGLERYVVWTKDLNFIMDGKGNMISEDPASPLAEYQIMPFIDVAMDKDFQYFVRGNDGVVDFTVQYNGALSDLANVVKMQGWGQAFIKGDKDLMPEAMVVGINHVLRLPIDPNSKVDTEFGFVTPNANIEGSIKYIEMLLSNYLSSKGLDSSMISTTTQGGEKFSSGIERLLSQIEKFEASKSDFSLFKKIELELFNIIKAWINVTSGTDMQILDSTIGDEITLSVKYHEPTMIQSFADKFDLISKQVDGGYLSKTKAVMMLYDVSREKAIEMLQEANSDIFGLDVSAVNENINKPVEQQKP